MRGALSGADCGRRACQPPSSLSALGYSAMDRLGGGGYWPRGVGLHRSVGLGAGRQPHWHSARL